MTAVVSPTLKSQLNTANPVNIADSLRQMSAGDFLEGVQSGLGGPTTITLTGLAEVAAITLAEAPLAILALAVTDSTTADDKGGYIVVPTGGVATTAGSGGVAGAGQVGTAIWDGSTGITFKAGAKVKAVKLLVWAKPATVAAVDFDAAAQI